MTSDRPLSDDTSNLGTQPAPGIPPLPEFLRPQGEPVSSVDWFRRAPNGGTVNAGLPATSAPPRDQGAATTER